MQTLKNNVVHKLKKLEKENYTLDYFSNLNIPNIDLENFPTFNNSIHNSNLYNTKLHIKLDNNIYYNIDLRGCNIFYNEGKVSFINTKFDNDQINYLNTIYNNKIKYNYETILKNKNLYITSYALLNIINDYFKIQNIKNKILTENISQDLVNFIESLLSYDKEGYLKKFYYSIKPELNNYEIIKMFSTNTIENITIRNLIIDDNIYKIFSNFNLINVKLENIIFTTQTKELFNLPDNILHKYSNVDNVSFPNINMEDYQSILRNRFNTDSPFTFKKNLYIELGRTCNGKCTFCRNNCLNDSNYNLNNILTNLSEIECNLDSIVIGGGEPTLKKHDLLELLKHIKYQSKYQLFTNGSIDKKILSTILENTCIKFNISRHSYSDEENANIFKINKYKILNSKDLSNISSRVNLFCTCFKNGIDSIYKIFNYLEYAQDCNIKKVVFSNLQNDASINTTNNINNSLEIENTLFEQCINILTQQGYKKTYPIISTGGYILYILKNDSKTLNTIIFKKYISKKELLKMWPTSVKKTYDFSMNPNGDIYANWSETGKKVKTLKHS